MPSKQAKKTNSTAILDNNLTDMPIKDDFESPESKIFSNLAESNDLSSEQLTLIGQEVWNGHRIDGNSIKSWLDLKEKYNKLFDMVDEVKDDPFPNSTNIKLPTITSAVFNTQARLSSGLFGNRRNIVKGMPLGKEEGDIERATRAARYLNWQITYQMDNFITGFGKSLLQLARDGVYFRKTYYDSLKGRNVSKSLRPENFVVEYYTDNLEESRRYTEVIFKTIHELRAGASQGLYLKKAVQDISTIENPLEDSYTLSKNKDNYISTPETDRLTPRRLYEQHTWMDLYNTGISKPYTILIDEITRKVLRITLRLKPKLVNGVWIVANTDNPKELSQREIKYYTSCSFIENDSSIYGFGYGKLLYTIVKAQNTAINSTIDSGHMAVAQTGFVKKKSGMLRGDLEIKNGTFTEVDLRGGAKLSDVIMPLNFKEPSQVLVNIISFLQGYSDRLTTVSELFTGALPRSDTAATSTLAAIEQGAKQLTEIQERVHYAVQKEFYKLVQLNSIYLDEEEYFTIVINQDTLFQNIKLLNSRAEQFKKQNIPPEQLAVYQQQIEQLQQVAISQDQEELLQQLTIAREDFSHPLDIRLVSDPNIISQQEVMQKADIIYQTIMTDQILSQSAEARNIAIRRKLESLNVSEVIINELERANTNIMSGALQQKEQQAFQEGAKQGQEEALKQMQDDFSKREEAFKEGQQEGRREGAKDNRQERGSS